MTMQVTLKLFSIAKDLAGFEERNIIVNRAARAEDVLRYLIDCNPKFEQWKSSLRLAVNLEYVKSDYPLQDGDEVAVIPPVSGG